MAEAKRADWRKSILWILAGVVLGIIVFLLLGRGCAPAPVKVEQPVVSQPDQPAMVIQDDDKLAIQRARNQALEEEIKRAEKALQDDPCLVLRQLEASDPRNAPTSPAVLPPADAPRQQPPAPQDGTNTATPPPDIKIPENLPEVKPPKPAENVAELMEQTTAFILALHADGQVGGGSGFFVAPGVIATNAHVLGSAPSFVAVGNPAMQGMRPAQVIAISTQEGYDFALLSVAGAQNMPYLRLTDTAKRTVKISAWGYPMFITANDPKLKALLMQGDISAAPEVVYSEGVVSVVLERTPPMIIHTAALSQGNSGGPLVDERGVVVGINTLIAKATESYSQSSVALPGKDLNAFMEKNGVKATPPDK